MEMQLGISSKGSSCAHKIRDFDVSVPSADGNAFIGFFYQYDIAFCFCKTKSYFITTLYLLTLLEING